LSALGSDVRGRFTPGGPGGPGGRGPFERDGGRHGFDGGPGHHGFDQDGGPKRRPPPDGMRPGPWSIGAPAVTLSAKTTLLFQEPSDFYYEVWSRSGNVLRRSTNAPADLAEPARSGTDTSLRTRTAQPNREAYQFTEIGECVLVGRSVV